MTIAYQNELPGAVLVGPAPDGWRLFAMIGCKIVDITKKLIALFASGG